MPCRNFDHEGDLEDFEYPDEDDDSDDDETVPCPECRRPVHEEAERCPGCGRYLSREDRPPARRPVWFVIGALLCLAVALGWALGR